LEACGLLLHLQNHVASHALPFTTVAFNEEFPKSAKLRFTFSRLDILSNWLINSTINMFIRNIARRPEKKTDDNNTITIVLPFRDQIAANAICQQLRDLSNKIAVTLRPVIVGKKLRKK